jgi:hypothetical protein
MQLESRLCSRARFWVSLRLDGCPACRAFAEDSAVATDRLRAAPLEAHEPVRIHVPRRGRTPLVVAVAAAVITAAVIAGGIVRNVLSPASESVPAPRPVAVVATSAEQYDNEFRQLRRTSLLGQRPIPRDLAV